MARNRVVVEQVVCDVCGKEIEHPTSVILGWGREQWELDLCDDDHDAIGATFDEWIAKGAKVGGRAPRRSRPAAEGSDSGAIREWAQANGLTVGAKGRISQKIRAAYEAATG